MTQYFEFKNQEYYALIASRVEDGDRFGTTAEMKAVMIYSKNVNGDTLPYTEARRKVGLPFEITKYEALKKFLTAPGTFLPGMTIKEAVKEFEEAKNELLLIDGGLV